MAPLVPSALKLPIPDQHKSHMADRAVGDLAFEIALREGRERCIDDVDYTKDHQQWCELRVGVGQHFSVETHQCITPHFQKDPCQQHVHRSCGLTMSIG